MKFEFFFQYSAWYIVLCLFSGALLAYFTYSSAFSKSQYSKSKRWLLGTLRGLGFALVFYLLFAPLIRYIKRTVEKPLIVLLQDNSQSIVANADSSFYRNEYQKSIEQFKELLGDEYELQIKTFGEKSKDTSDFSFSEKVTNLSEAIEQLEADYFNRNMGATVVASDGIYNQGNNPLYAKFPFQAPIYSVALGQTTIRKDLFISKVNHNPIAFLNNDFPVEVLVQARKAKGANSIVSVYFKGNEIASKPISITDDNYFEAVNFVLPAKESGLQRYEIKLKTIADEFTFENNLADVFIEIVDGRQKILILSDGVHADIGAIKQALQSSKTIEVESALLTDFKKNLSAYSLVIFYQLPSKSSPNVNFIDQAFEQNIPSWFIFGEQTNWLSWNKLNAGFVIQNFRPELNQATATYNDGFGLFQLSDEWKKVSKNWPPLDVPFGEIKGQADLQVILKQKIGSVATPYPLMAFLARGNQKLAFTLGEGMWRWRLQNYAQSRSHEIFNEFVSKTVQFLSLKLNKNRFLVLTRRSLFENERIQLDAELFNESYEPVKNVDIQLSFFDESNKEYTYTFSKTANSYQLDLGLFAPGNYRYVAKTSFNNTPFETKGSITVKPLRSEWINTTADHQLLLNLAEKHKGKLFQPNEWEKLAAEIKANDSIKPLSYSESSLNEWIEFRWLFLLGFLLLAAEWLLRRLSGNY